MLPWVYIRRNKARRALTGYPRYDPPFKVEERLLKRPDAIKNLEYFHSVRKERHGFFVVWLATHFGTAISNDRAGVKVLNEWAFKYVGPMLYDAFAKDELDSYCYYTRPWTGD